MANIDRIVTVQIDLNTTAIREQSFSDLLVLGPHAVALPRVLVVTGADDLLELGLTVFNPLYRAVRDVFKQIPTLNRCFVGRQQVDEIDISVTGASASEFAITLQWYGESQTVWSTTATVEGKAGDTPQDIAQALAAAIAAQDVPVTAVSVGSALTLAAKVDGQAFAVRARGSLSIREAISREPSASALAACRREQDAWYGVCLTSRAEADVLDAAEWAESNEKLFGVGVASPGVIDLGTDSDLASRLMAKQYFRTHVWYHEQAALEWLEAAISANRFAFYPGSETWGNVKLAGITADNVGESEHLAAYFKNVNTFEPFRNFALTQGGKVAAGEWIDVIRFRDWLAEPSR